jgi:hypothetical protein
VIIISLGRIWFATIGASIAVVIGWAFGAVDDGVFENRFLLWIPAIAVTIDAWLRRGLAPALRTISLRRI